MVVVAPLSIRQRRDGRRPYAASSVGMVLVVAVVVVVGKTAGCTSPGYSPIRSIRLLYLLVAAEIKVRSYGTQLSVLSTK